MNNTSPKRKGGRKKGPPSDTQTVNIEEELLKSVRVTADSLGITYSKYFSDALRMAHFGAVALEQPFLHRESQELSLGDFISKVANDDLVIMDRAQHDAIKVFFSLAENHLYMLQYMKATRPSMARQIQETFDEARLKLTDATSAFFGKDPSTVAAEIDTAIAELLKQFEVSKRKTGQRTIGMASAVATNSPNDDYQVRPRGLLRKVFRKLKRT